MAASNEVIYAIAVQGAQDAINAFNNVNKAAVPPKEAAAGWSGLSGGLDKVSDAAKKVSRDIDATGSKVTENALRNIDNVTGLAAAIAMGPLSLVGAVGMAAAGWAIYSVEAGKAEATNKLAKTTTDGLVASTRALAEQQINLEEADAKKLAHMEDVVNLTIKQNALNLQAFQLNVMGMRMMLQASEKTLGDFDPLNDPTGMVGIAKHKVLTDNLAENEATLTALITEQAKMRTAAEDLHYRKTNAASAESTEKREKDSAKAADNEAAAFARGQSDFYRVMDARARAYNKDKEDRLKAQKELGDLLEEAEQINAADQAEKDKRASEERTRALKEEADAAKKAADERRKLTSAISDTLLLKMPMQIFSEVYSASMFAIGTATSFASSQLKEFGNINRDNWRDVLAMTEDKKAAFFAEAQAALFNMGVQAGTQAVFENAESLKESALALGSAAMMDGPGALLHGAAAATHAVSSMAYSALSAGGIGASFAIGGMRGKGGLVSAGPGRGGARGSGEGGAGASPRGGGGYGHGGGNGEGGGTNITFVYEAGSINAADERATARTVANGVGNARGSWFERRRMERRV